MGSSLEFVVPMLLRLSSFCMCLAIPGKVLETSESHGLKMAKVSFGGMVKQICLEYTPEAAIGDYVLVHVGFALSVVDQEEAERTYKLLEEMGQLTELNGPSAE
jgi:hydrogenase expression/formation protein HypC